MVMSQLKFDTDHICRQGQPLFAQPAIKMI